VKCELHEEHDDCFGMVGNHNDRIFGLEQNVFPNMWPTIQREPHRPNYVELNKAQEEALQRQQQPEETPGRPGQQMPKNPEYLQEMQPQAGAGTGCPTGARHRRPADGREH
jgi:hypothetical protein